MAALDRDGNVVARRRLDPRVAEHGRVAPSNEKFLRLLNAIEPPRASARRPLQGRPAPALSPEPSGSSQAETRPTGGRSRRSRTTAIPSSASTCMRGTRGSLHGSTTGCRPWTARLSTRSSEAGHRRSTLKLAPATRPSSRPPGARRAAPYPDRVDRPAAASGRGGTLRPRATGATRGRGPVRIRRAVRRRRVSSTARTGRS